MRGFLRKTKGFFLARPVLCLFAYAFALALAVLLFSAISTSPLYAGDKWDAIDKDSNWFMFMGEEILRGKIPYLEFYDQKGLFCFAINAAGLFLAGKTGVFLFEWLFAGTTTFFLFLSLSPMKK